VILGSKSRSVKTFFSKEPNFVGSFLSEGGQIFRSFYSIDPNLFASYPTWDFKIAKINKSFGPKQITPFNLQLMILERFNQLNFDY